MTNTTTKRAAIPALLLFAVAAIWGSGFVASQMALDAGVSPELLMAVRFSTATLVILLSCGKRLATRLQRKDLRGGLLVGLFLFLGFYLQIVALQFTTPSNNAFITASNVVMVPFIGWAISKKRPNRRIFFSSVLCLIGIGILSVKLSSGLAFTSGDLLTLVCAFFFACQIAATGHYAARMDTMVLVFLQFAVSAALSVVIWLGTDRSLVSLTTLPGLGSVLYLGLFSTCLCFFLQTTAQRYVSASKAAIILACESLFGTLFSVLIGYERFTLPMLLGGAVIMVSLVLTETGPAAGAKQ